MCNRDPYFEDLERAIEEMRKIDDGLVMDLRLETKDLQDKLRLADDTIKQLVAELVDSLTTKCIGEDEDDVC